MKFNYIYQELFEFKQKITQEVYFQAITKYSFASMIAKRTKNPSYLLDYLVDDVADRMGESAEHPGGGEAHPGRDPG